MPTDVSAESVDFFGALAGVDCDADAWRAPGLGSTAADNLREALVVAMGYSVSRKIRRQLDADLAAELAAWDAASEEVWGSLE